MKLSKNLLLIIAIAASILLLLLIWLGFGKATITLCGQTDMQVEFGGEYAEYGASAVYRGFPFGDVKISDPITPVGTVDVNKLGTYTVKYCQKFLWHSSCAERTVKVVDTQAPVITLITGEGYTVPGKEYLEEGFTAWDNHDGDITDKVTVVMGAGEVIYTVKDSSGNETRQVRTIRYLDPDAPLLTLKGSQNITISAGDAYREPGYTALDSVDGDLTSAVKVEGYVNIYLAGEYELKYTVTDSYGNSCDMIRKVTVLPRSQPAVVPTEGKVIYLTFDDGPSAYTPQLLEILERYQVKATFFVASSGYNYLLPDIVEAGHAIGVHTTTHRYNEIYASVEAYFADMLNMQQIIYEKTGVWTTLLRFPGGSANASSEAVSPGIMTVLRKAVVDMGFQYFDWNVSSGDAGGTNVTAEIVNNVISGIQGKETAVVLQHDIFKYSVDAVEQIIEWGLANGYTFLPLTPESPPLRQR